MAEGSLTILESTIQTGVTLTEYGIPIVLIHPGLKTPIPNPSDKSWWTIDDPDLVPEVIKAAGPAVNIGVLLGQQKQSPIIGVGVDLYKPEGREATETIKTLGVATRGHVWVCRTGRGGITVFYFYNGELLERQAATLNPALDLMSNGFSLVPPSNTHKIAGGGPYTWIAGHSPADIPMGELEEPPAALIEYWNRLKNAKSKAVKSAGPDHEELDIFIDAIPDGQRNQEITRRFGWLLKKYGVGAEAMIRSINQSCCQPPLEDREMQTIIGSISKAEGPSVTRIRGWAIEED